MPIPSEVDLPSEGRLLLAFSCGEDSLFLLMLLSYLAPGRSEALYVDHGIRARDEIENEIALAKSNAERLSLPLHIIHLKAGEVHELSVSEKTGIEAAARKLRYRALERFADDNGFDWILTAHHEDDQAETLMMRMLSKAPFYSWSGIQRREGRICRPLLTLPKNVIRSEVARSGLHFSADSTNSDTSYRRNWIRHHLLPLLSEEDKRLLSAIALNIQQLRRNVQTLSPSLSYYAELERASFLAAHPAERERIVFLITSFFGHEGRLSRSAAAAVYDKASEGRGHLLFRNIYFSFRKECIRVYPLLDDFVIPLGDEDIAVGNLRLSWQKEDDKSLIIDKEVLLSPIVRTNREGDSIELAEGHRLVSDLLASWHIPQAIVLEDRIGIRAVFARVLGGRDRLSSSLLNRSGTALTLALSSE